MTKHLVFPLLTLALATSTARAGETYTSPSGHFSFAVPAGLVPLTAAELTGENAATAAEGGTPRLYEAGFEPPAAAGHHGPRLPQVLVRFVPGPVTFTAFADDYKAAVDKAYAAAAAAHPPTSGPTTTPAAGSVDPAAPDVRIDTAAGVVASERRRPVHGGTVVKRETVFVGHQGVAVVEWSGTPTEGDAELKPMLASFRFEPGFGYQAADVYAVKEVVPARDGRRTAAAAIVGGGAVLFLACAVLFFVRARRRATR